MSDDSDIQRPRDSGTLYAMWNARDALAEYYRDDAPVVVLLDSAIVDVEGFNRAYELLFKENVKLRKLASALLREAPAYTSNGDPVFSDKTAEMARDLRLDGGSND